MAKYAIRGYEVQALDYVLKPVKYEAFTVKMDKVKKACREEKRQKHQYKDRYGNPPSAAVPYPVCGGGTASLDIPHRGRGFSTRGVLKDVEAVLEENGFTNATSAIW